MASLSERAKLAAKALVGVFSDESAKQAFGLLAGIFPGASGAAPTRGVRERIAAYADMPWLHAVADKVASAVAAVEWQLKVVKPARAPRAIRVRALQRLGGDLTSLRARQARLAQLKDAGDLVEITEHPLLDDVLDGGNAYMTGLATRKVTALHWDLEGEAFWLKERSGLGVPIGVWPLSPAWIMATPTPSRRAFRVSFRGWQGEIPDTEILWMANPDPANPYGRGSGMARALADELETDEMAARFMRQTFINQARPDFIVYPKAPATWGEPERLRLEQQWRSQHEGFWRGFKARFASRELGVYEFGETSMRNLQMVQIRQFERDMIVQTFGVPPEILGILEACLDADTECLTRRGWVRHDQLTESDEIATWNEDLSRLEYHRPRRIMRFDHDGPMHHWTGRIDFMCTAAHRLWVRHGRRRGAREGWRFAASAEVAAWTSAHWRVTGGGYDGAIKTVTLPGWHHGLARRHLDPATPAWRHQPIAHPATTIDVETFAPFLGYWLAEGWADTNGGYGVLYSQNVGTFADAMRRAMMALDLGRVASRIKGSQHVEYRVAHKGLWTWLRTEAGFGARNKRLPAEVFEWPQSAQRALFEALIDGDGSRRRGKNGTTIRYASVSERLVDDIQRLCVHLGLRAMKAARAEDWHLTITEGAYQAIDRYARASSGTPRVAETHYRGIVWCVEVENGRFFTRRNGRIVCHGNSNRATIQAATDIFARWVLVPRLEAFRAILQERLVPEYDDRLILDYVSPVPKDREFALEVGKAASWAWSVDEWRALAGREPLGHGVGEVYAQPFNLTFGALNGDGLEGGVPPDEAAILRRLALRGRAR